MLSAVVEGEEVWQSLSTPPPVSHQRKESIVKTSSLLVFPQRKKVKSIEVLEESYLCEILEKQEICF